MSKRSDPRFGDTTYTLTNIQRQEPTASLFAVPADYTVTQGGPGSTECTSRSSTARRARCHRRPEFEFFHRTIFSPEDGTPFSQQSPSRREGRPPFLEGRKDEVKK